VSFGIFFFSFFFSIVLFDVFSNVYQDGKSLNCPDDFYMYDLWLRIMRVVQGQELLLLCLQRIDETGTNVRLTIYLCK
jgi:hypothetical protein